MVGGAALGPSAVGSPSAVRATSHQAVVKLKAGSTPGELDSQLTGLGASRGADLGGGWWLVHLAPGQSVSSALLALRTLPALDAADPSRVYEASREPNDPLASTQYALQAVNASAGWEYEVGSSSRVTIAVVDTGIDSTHPDLSAKLTNTSSKQFDPNTGAQSNNQPATPACNHATRVSGVAAASTDNGLQVAGVSWGAQLLSLKVFTDASCPQTNCSDAGCVSNDPGVIAAINHAATLQNSLATGKIVVNISLGSVGSCPGAMQTAVTNAVTAGVVIVAAAGNDGGNVQSPGNCTGVIPVGATDTNNNVASFSSRGTALANQGLVAPGVGLLTTDQGGGTASATGTSFSSPMVAGAAALVLSAKPTFTPAQVSAALRGGADNIGVSALGTAPSGAVSGAGRMNVYKSLRLAINGTLSGFDGEAKPIAFPNPFRPSTSGTVSFAIPPSLQGASAKIKVYTLTGQLVKELTGLSWNGKNAEGTDVASGTYVFVVTTSAGTGRGRFSVLR